MDKQINERTSRQTDWVTMSLLEPLIAAKNSKDTERKKKGHTNTKNTHTDWVITWLSEKVDVR